MDALAVLFEAPEQLSLSWLPLEAAGEGDLLVEVDYSGISTGTERLLYRGRMPAFPGMGYPLVPGYETVGRVVEAGRSAKRRPGDAVFVPGARCFGPVRGLFGGAASHLVVSDDRAISIDKDLGEEGVLLALAATARHAITAGSVPELIVGHGVLGRLIARIVVALGGPAPTVWEANAGRRDGAKGYAVTSAEADPRRDYAVICDASGDPAILDTLIARLAPGGEVVLAGFYEAPLSFAFPPAFMREARLRVAAEFKPADVADVVRLIGEGRLSLSGLITHRHPAVEAPAAYDTAFGDPACLKMILDWRGRA